MPCDKKFDVGILFVHGIGTQSRGQTLSTWGESLFRWIDRRCLALERRWERVRVEAKELDSWQYRLEQMEWGAHAPATETSPDLTARAKEAGCAALARRIVLRETRFDDVADSRAPPYSVMELHCAELDGRLTSEHWLLAESWWAESFAPPTFRELTHWTFGILPWIIGSHFAVQVTRRLASRPRFDEGLGNAHDSEAATPTMRGRVDQRIWSLAGWAWGVGAATGRLGLGLLATVLAMPLLAVVLILGALPVPNVRSFLLRLQLRLAATIGDSYVLLDRPIEAASIVGQVRRDLNWMADRCHEVIVVAHSQGAAVAHLSLRGPVRPELRLLFTFGSGLRKLEELRALSKHGASLVFSARYTVVALGVFVLLAWLLAAVVLTGDPASPASFVIVLAVAAVALAVCIAGFRDYLRGIELPDLNRWIDWLGSSRVRWHDCYASADPVPNGTVVPRARDRSREVWNLGSTLRDHTAYWSNQDQFVSGLWDQIAASRTRDTLPDLRLPDGFLEHIGRRRGWRVSVGKAIQWMALVGVALAIGRTLDAWQALGTWGWQAAGNVISGTPYPDRSVLSQLTIHWLAVGYLLVIMIPYWVVRHLWAAWNDDEMQMAIDAASDDSSSVLVMVGVTFFSLIVGGMTSGVLPPYLFYLLFFLCWTVPTIVFTVREPSSRFGEPSAGTPTAAQSEAYQAAKQKSDKERAVSSVENLVSLVIGSVVFLSAPLVIGAVFWEAATWVVTLVVGGSIAGFRPASVPSELVGLTAAVLTAVAIAVRRFWSWRSSELESPPAD